MNPPPQTFDIRNSGDGTLNYQITTDQPWLFTFPNQGSSTGEADRIEVSVNSERLAESTFRGTITISQSQVQAAKQIIPVTLVVTPAAPGMPGPEISSGGIILATGTPVVEQVSPLGIFTIFGREFAPQGTLAIQPELAANGAIATNLAQTCVEIDGERSPLFAVLPTQINGQASHLLQPGQATVEVIRGCGTNDEQRSPVATVTIGSVTPSFFNFVNNPGGANPIAALHGGGPELVGEPGLIPGATSTPAQPNEFVSLFATGFGPTDPALESGQIPSEVLPDSGGRAALTSKVTFTIGGIAIPPADVLYAGAAPCCVGLYQFVVRVPPNAKDGNLAVTATVDGVSTPDGPFITVGGGGGGGPTGQTTFTANPNPITTCPNGLGRTTLSWNAPGVSKVEIRIDSLSGTSMGTKDPSGSAQTGDWVRDGMTFFLREAGTTRELARVTVGVRCGAPGEIYSPRNGSTLSSSRASFQWTRGQGVTEFRLLVGSSLGRGDIFDRRVGLSLSATFTVPADGRQIYVRLLSHIAGSWRFRDYRYTAPAAPRPEFRVLQRIVTSQEPTQESGCPTLSPDTAFMTHEQQATLYFQADGVRAGDVFEFRWRDRTGSERRVGRWQSSQAGNRCFWDILRISGNSAITRRPGRWSVSVLHNGREIFQLSFSIVSVPLAQFSRVSPQSCSSPPARTERFFKTDLSAFLLYRVGGGLEVGDQLRVEWRDSSGTVRDAVWDPRTSPGGGCFSSELWIASRGLRAGRYSAHVSLNNSDLFELAFTIQ